MIEAIQNDKTMAGQLASDEEIFGERHNFLIAAIHTRFNAVIWFVWDTETFDEIAGHIAIIRQTETRDQAIKGLDA